MDTPHTVIWTQEECAQYRAEIQKRLLKKGDMEMPEEWRAFLEQRHDEPLVLYRTRWHHMIPLDMDDPKESAFEQISIICGGEEPMGMFVIHHDFGVNRPHNADLPPTTQELFGYIDANAEALVAEMLTLGILERVVAEF
jgi:hypothetical protein